MQSAADDEVGLELYVPLGQGVAAELPVPLAYHPLPASTHDVELVLGWKVPSGQGVWLA